MKNSIKIKELFRFLIGGGSAVITDYLIYVILLSISMDISIAKTISFICGSIVGFIINKLWTFESKSFKKAEVGKYATFYSITAVINSLVNNLVLSLIGMQSFAFLCATGISTVLNFLGQKFFVFSSKGE
ncbi:GtrA family protein [Clostridium butyricum]|uniref:GtrA family protein n=1 Tax=Clostridium butyricum TaxID=1492 RepID=UPI00374F3262